MCVYVCSQFSTFITFRQIHIVLSIKAFFSVKMESSKEFYLPLNQSPLLDERDDGQNRPDSHALASNSSFFSKSTLAILILALCNVGFLSRWLYEMKTKESPLGYGMLSSIAASFSDG